MLGGTPVPGSTSVASSPSRSPPRTFTAPISVMASLVGAPPVVSRSSTTNVTSRNGVPSSSNDSCVVGVGDTAGKLAAHPDKNRAAEDRAAENHAAENHAPPDDQRRNTGTTKNGPRAPTL